MSDINFRQGATQVERAVFNAGMVKLVSFEILVLAVVVGAMNKSWTWGLGLFFGLIAAFNVPQVRSILALGFSIAWSVLAYIVMRAMAPGEPAAPLIAAGAALLISLACHACFFQWQKDLA
jgi:hypothetical protein